jgi:hypothetical protein
METLLNKIPGIGPIYLIDLEPSELRYAAIFQNLRPNLVCSAMVQTELCGPKNFQIEIAEVIEPNARNNETFFRKCFDGLMALEANERLLYGGELERHFELEGPRWILMGGIVGEGFVVPPPIVLAYYEKPDSLGIYSVILREEINQIISTHIMFHPLN